MPLGGNTWRQRLATKVDASHCGNFVRRGTLPRLCASEQPYRGCDAEVRGAEYVDNINKIGSRPSTVWCSQAASSVCHCNCRGVYIPMRQVKGVSGNEQHNVVISWTFAVVGNLLLNWRL